jgi:Transposase DDE domain
LTRGHRDGGLPQHAEHARGVEPADAVPAEQPGDARFVQARRLGRGRRQAPELQDPFGRDVVGELEQLRLVAPESVGAGSRGGYPGCGWSVTLSGMPFKHHAARRHRIPQARYRVRNWRDYEAGLKRRGDLTLWLDEAAIAGWQAPQRSTPGGQAWYSDAAIELVLMLRFAFHLALRQAEGFAGSVLRLLGLDLRVPDHTTLCRRSRRFAGRRPKVAPHGPMHLVIDSTGLKLFGQGEWDAEKHGRARRSWRKLHIAVDADSGEIVACVLTGNAASR